MSCLFCRIIAGEIPSSKVYEDDEVFAFNDINPQAPLHVLIVRRAAAIAAENGYAERGYRTVFNCNAEAGQTVFHVHLHLLAGRSLGWPPG